MSKVRGYKQKNTYRDTVFNRLDESIGRLVHYIALNFCLLPCPLGQFQGCNASTNSGIAEMYSESRAESGPSIGDQTAGTNLSCGQLLYLQDPAHHVGDLLSGPMAS